MLPQTTFSILNFAAGKGFAGDSVDSSAKQLALKAGLRGETFGYWYLRREGYIVIARNFTIAGIKGELDIVAYDGAVLAFVEVKTRAKAEPGQPTPEDAINLEKRRNLARMARQFLRARRLENIPWKFDVLAIETTVGQKPIVHLYKSAFSEHKS
jgi:putative endonuclease